MTVNSQLAWGQLTWIYKHNNRLVLFILNQFVALFICLLAPDIECVLVQGIYTISSFLRQAATSRGL
jgi:hypothetical protein